MKSMHGPLMSILLISSVWVVAASERPRVIVLTDISNEPDDEESLVRFLVYSNEFEVEGLIATTSVWLRGEVRPDLIRRQIEAYAQVRENLLVHAPGYPAVKHLLNVTKAGIPEFGMEGVGPGKNSEGSRHIQHIVDRADSRPVWITVWGGANCLAQALWEVKNSRSSEELGQFVSKLRVYTISDQDDSGKWMRENFPGLVYIVSPSAVDSREYHRATWTGISGDRHYRNGPGHRFELVDNPWLEKNVIRDHGPLGALYPKLVYIMEGDTPSFLGLINLGLASHLSPDFGGWGGRYVLYRNYGETRPIWTNNRDSRDTVQASDGRTYTSDQATIWRWREAFQNDFAARMDWCVAKAFTEANHNPIVAIDGNSGRHVVEISIAPGQSLTLDAGATSDPDGDGLSFRWFQYREAGTYGGDVQIHQVEPHLVKIIVPPEETQGTVHIILEVRDTGTPPLFAYRRILLEVAGG